MAKTKFTNNFNATLKSLADLLGKDVRRIIFRAEGSALKDVGVFVTARVTKIARTRLGLQGSPGRKQISAAKFKKEFVTTRIKIPKKGAGSIFVTISGKSLPMSRFLQSPRKPPKQKGIRPTKSGKNKGTYSRRRKVKVMVFKGNPTTLKKAFVFNAKTGGVQIGVRRGGKKRVTRSDGQRSDRGFIRLTAASIASFFRTLKVKKNLQKSMSAKFELRFRSKFNALAKKELERRVKSGLKSKLK